MLNLVADLSHYNRNPAVVSGALDFGQAYRGGLRAIIHKATEGIGNVDQMYALHRPQALRAGLLWGAYHFGHDADGVAQATHFLAHAQADSHTLLVLDFELGRAGGIDMTVQQAEQFVLHVYQHTGRYPGLYSSPAYLQETRAHLSPILRQCWLWIACYEVREEPPPQVGWSHWALWQYTDGKHGQHPRTASGIGSCDRSMFNGQLDDLRQLWGYAPAPPAPVPAGGEAQVVRNPPPILAQPVAISQRLLNSKVVGSKLGTLKSEGLKLGATLLTSLPVAQAIRVGITSRVAVLKHAIDTLHLSSLEIHLLLTMVAVVGCYVARLAAAHVGTVAATAPTEASAT